MAIETEKLVAGLEARIDKFEKAFKKARSVADSSLGAIEDRTKRSEDILGALGSRGAANMNKLGQATKATSFQAGTMAAQFNDIATQLAGGQSPFLIALQQGSQISQMLGPGGAGQAVKLLGAGFLSMVSPINLATIAFIGLGGAAVQYFATLLNDGQKSAEELQKQQQLVAQVADKWGDAVPALREYVESLKEAQSIGELQQATQQATADIFGNVNGRLDELSVGFADVVTRLQEMGASRESILTLQEAFDRLQEKTADGTAATEDLQRVTSELAKLNSTYGVSAIGQMIGALGALAEAYASASAKAKTLRDQQAAVLGGVGKYPSPGTYGGVYRPEDSSIQGESFPLPENGPVPDARPKIELEGLSRVASGRDRAAAAAQREKEAVADLIEQLEFERSMVGATQLEREKAVALRRAGSAATSEQRQQIEMLVEATYKEKTALEESAKAMEEMKGLAKDVLGGLVSDLRAGKSGAEALANALDRVIDKLVDGALNSLLDGVFGTGSGKGFLSIFGFADGGIASRGRPVPRFASGGVSKTAAVFGEAGPEAAVPLPDGRRIPVDLRVARPPQSAPSNAPIQITFSPVIDARGADPAAISRLEKALQKQNAEFSGRVVKTIQEARMRNVKV